MKADYGRIAITLGRQMRKAGQMQDEVLEYWLRLTMHHCVLKSTAGKRVGHKGNRPVRN